MPNIIEKKVHFLTTKESLWLKNRKEPLKIGITQIPNQILKEGERYRGYSIDLFKIIEKLLDIRFRYIYYDSWDKVLNAGKNRDIDIIFLAQKTENRLKSYNFTDIVLIQHNKILTLNNSLKELTVKDLFNKKVAVVKHSAIAEYIKMNFPKIITIDTKSETNSLKLLLDHKVDYTIAEPVRIGYYIKKNNLNDIYIAGTFPYDYKLRIASRNDMPIINIILNKALEHIPYSQKKSLSLKWGYEKDTTFDKQLLIKILIIGCIAILLLAYLIILNRKLKKAKDKLSQINQTLKRRVSIEVEKNIKKEKIMLQQSRLAQMGELLSMIAHQWKQPLNSLSILNQLLLLKYSKNKLDQDFLDYFKTNSQKQIRYMSNTIDDFSNFFKPEQEREDFDINETIEHVLEIVRPLYSKYSIKIHFHSSGSLITNGYPNKLAQALLNIINNAKDALVENKIEDKKIKILSQLNEKDIVISIIDNAGGIPKNIIEKIFDPYFSTKSEKNGTGIGLYMSKIIIEKHMNGILSVENTEEGAMFKIYLKSR